jgi:hypothetical protein
MNSKSIPSDGSFGPLSPRVNSYLAQVKEQGYAVGSICEQLCVLKMFGRWLQRTGREVRDLNEVIACDFLRRLRRGYPKNAARSTLRRVLAMLRGMGATPAAVEARPGLSEQLTCSYERFLVPRRFQWNELAGSGEVTGHYGNT